MNVLHLLFTSILILNSVILFDSKEKSNLNNWSIVDDVVMGGRSDGHFEINEKGIGVFHGVVSLENNGGFSSVRYRCNQKNLTTFKTVEIRLKGDGKRYQFRVKSEIYDRHSYIYHFETGTEWETIEIPLADMTPAFRGRRLDMPNYPREELAELAFLIANKKAESFQLEISSIVLK